MAERITLDQSFAIWAQGVSDDVDEHVPMSMLFDFVQQALNASERERLLRHLATCLTCGQALKDVTIQKAPAVRLVEELGLAASTHRQPPGDREAFSITEDREHKVRFIRNVLGDVTFLKVEVKPPYRHAFEHKQIAIYDGEETLVGRGRIRGGTVSWRLSGDISGRLSLRVEPEGGER